jgi:RNA polymerase sigma factor (sigma-70 family)
MSWLRFARKERNSKKERALMATKTFEHKTEIQKLQDKIKYGIDDYKKNDQEDKALIVAYKNGNEQAGMTLVHNYLDVISYIYRFPYNPPRRGKKARFIGKKPHINAQDREDLLQEILYHFFVLVNEYDPEFGKPFQALVKGKLHHRVHNNFFKEFLVIDKHEEAYDEDFESKYLDDTKSILLDEEATQKLPANYIELYQALNQLGARQREVMILSEVKGWNASEIADELGITPVTVRRTKQEALRKLREIMIKEGE